jgi:thiol-disulfide isomerase/thioredoxin
MKKLILPAVFLILVAAIVLSFKRSSIQDSSEVSDYVTVAQIEEEAPLEETAQEPLIEVVGPDTLYTLEGEAFKYIDLISYPKTVLFIWTTKCGVCKDELKRLSKNCSSYKGVKVFFINAGESQEKVMDFSSYYGLRECVTNKILLDRQAYVARKFYVSNVPTVVFFEYGTPIHKSYTINQYLIDRVYEAE